VRGRKPKVENGRALADPLGDEGERAATDARGEQRQAMSSGKDRASRKRVSAKVRHHVPARDGAGTAALSGPSSDCEEGVLAVEQGNSAPVKMDSKGSFNGETKTERNPSTLGPLRTGSHVYY